MIDVDAHNAQSALEQNDWAAIEQWRRATSHEFHMHSGAEPDDWVISLIDWGPKCERRGGPFVGKRAEAVRAAADWCRAELNVIGTSEYLSRYD